VFDLCKGNEKGHAISDDTASLLAYTEKNGFCEWRLACSSVEQNMNHEISSSPRFCSYFFWPSVGDAGDYWQEL